MIHIQSFAFNPFSENTYVIYNDKKNAFIVDPGNFTPDENKILENFIVEKGLKVENILLTHAHIDHVLGLQWTFDKYQVPVLMHETEKEILDRNPLDANRFGFFFKPFEGTIHFVKEGEKIVLGDEIFEVLYVPGHSPGHIAYHHANEKIVISGDVLFEGSIGRTDLYKGNHAELLGSIRTKIFVLPEDTKVYNGHGNPTSVGFEKQYNPFLN